MAKGKVWWREVEGWLQIYGVLWKQYLWKHRFWLLLLFLCALLGGIWNRTRGKEEEEYRGVSIGVCAEDDRGRELLAKLEEKQGIFRFRGFDSEEEMLRQIESGELECGYVLSCGFYDHILQGKRNRQITLYYSPASSVHKISYEVVFADLFQMLSADLLENYLKDYGFLEGQEQILAFNEKYITQGDTFAFVYERVGEQAGSVPENLDTIRGCAAVLMFLMSLLGLGNVLGQEYTWGSLPGSRGRKLKSAEIHICVLGSTLTGGLCLWLLGCMKEPWKEAAALLLYVVLLEIFVRILGLFVRKDSVLYGLLPGALLCSLVFCPVFFHIERYLPGAVWISRCFPPTYYLNFTQIVTGM